MFLEFCKNFAKHIFNLLLVQSINVKEGFGTSYSWDVKHDPKMAGISTVKFMDNTITIDHDQLWSVFRMGLLNFFEQMKGRR